MLRSLGGERTEDEDRCKWVAGLDVLNSVEVIPGYVSCHTILLSRNLSNDVFLSYTLAGTRKRNLRVYTYQAHKVTKSPAIHPWPMISGHTPGLQSSAHIYVI